MARRGLILREIDPNDRRRARFQLTSKGAAIHAEGERTISRVESELLEGFEEQERSAFCEMLGRLNLAARILEHEKTWHDFL